MRMESVTDMATVKTGQMNVFVVRLLFIIGSYIGYYVFPPFSKC